VPGCPDQVAEDVPQECDDADLPSTLTELRSSTPRLPQETKVGHQLAQPHPMEGAWVAEDMSPRMRKDFSFLTIKKGTLVTANLDTFRVPQGPNPHTIAFADACLCLQSDSVMRLCTKSGGFVLFKRVDDLCRTNLASLQGRWTQRSQSRHQTKTLTIQGNVFGFSIQHFGQHSASQGLLRWQDGAIAMEEFKFSIISHEHFMLRSPSGHVWRFRRAP